jgi:hypothetical protein
VLLGNSSIGTFSSSDNIDALFTISLRDGVVADVSCIIDVGQISLSASGKTYTKAEIASVASSSPEMLGAIKYALKDKISNQLSESFPNASVTSNTELPMYQDQRFLDEYILVFSSSFFNLNQSVDSNDFINGMLDVGFTVNYSFQLSALEGWNNTYTVLIPNSLTYKQTTGKVQGNTIQWELKNWDGSHPINEAGTSLYETNPTTSKDLKEKIDIGFRINCTNPDAVTLENVFLINLLSINNYDILPSFLSNENVLPSDAIRLCVQSNLLSWIEVYNKTLNPLNNELVSIIEDRAFNQTVHMLFAWDNMTTINVEEPYNKSNMNSLPPIRGIFKDDEISLNISNISSKAMFGLINAGAKATISGKDINFGQSLDELHKPYTGLLLLPSFVNLNGSDVFQWDENTSIAGSFSSTTANMYVKPEITANVDMEVKSTDLNLLSFFTGKTEVNVEVYMKETQQNSVISLPSMFSLPSNVNLSWMNADALRLCITENVFSKEDVELYLSEHRTHFKNISRTIIPSLIGNTQSDISSFENSLLWDGNISAMDGDNPVEVVSYIHSSYSLSCYFSIIPPSFKVSSQNLTFTGIPDQNVTYKMLFPSGVSIDVDDTLSRAYIESIGDRVQLCISFNSSEGNIIDVVSCKIHPSFLYIIGMFTPCILSVIITLILFIVVYLLRKKRNQSRGPGFYKKNHNEQDYSNQEYYVPPPPPSSR